MDQPPDWLTWKEKKIQYIKVAEHSFQMPMPNSPLLLYYLWLGARFLQESWLTIEEGKVCAVAMATGLFPLNLILRKVLLKIKIYTNPGLV